MLNATGIGHAKNPSATKTGPGRRHVEGHKKDSFVSKRSGKLGSGWMRQRLLRHITEKNLQQIADRRAKLPSPEKPAPLTVEKVIAEIKGLTPEQFDTWLVDRIFFNPGLSFSELYDDGIVGMTETQFERRLKKLREAGRIRYDKSAKGWFAVNE